jgi:hypothetical protein
MPFRPPSGAGLAGGPKWRIMAPPAVPRTRCYAGESPRVSVIRVLWGPGWTRLPHGGRAKYCHNGGMALAHPSRRRLAWGSDKGDDRPFTRSLETRCYSEGSAIAIMATVAVPRKLPICRGKGLGVRDSRPLVSGMDSSWPHLAERCRRGKYCHEGGMAFARRRARGCPSIFAAATDSPPPLSGR